MADVAGNVIVVESVPDRVSVFVKFSVFPAVPVSVYVPVVNVFPFIVVAVAAPMFGVVKTGEVVMATFPDPEMVYSPKTPELSKRTFVFVPDAIVVVPTVRGTVLVV